MKRRICLKNGRKDLFKEGMEGSVKRRKGKICLKKERKDLFKEGKEGSG